MIQVFFLTEIYLVAMACVLLSDKYGVRFLFLLNMARFYESGQVRLVSCCICGILAALNLVFPVNEGFYIVGDLLPAVMLLLLLGFQIAWADKKSNGLGFSSVTVAIVHFIFARVIIL